MKFLAILKDSYKEAVSGWVLQALMVLAALLMIFVVGLSFRPLSPEEDIERQFGLLNLFLHNDPNVGRPEWHVENFVQLNAPEPYWKGNYKFDVVVRSPSAEDLEKVKKTEGLPTSEEDIRRMVKQQASYLKNVTTKPAANNPPGELRYEFRTEGTKVEEPLAWRSQPYLFFAVPAPSIFWMSLRQAVYRVEKTLVNDIGSWGAMLVSVIITAGFIPNLLRKGALDLYIAKPIGRVQLLLYKYIGGLTWVFLLAAFSVGGVWLMIGVRTGVWSPNFLLTIPIMTFYFAILYAISTLVAVLTRNTMVAILVTVVCWAVVFGVGFAHDTVETINRESQKQFVELKKKQGQEGVNPEDAKAAQPIHPMVEEILFGVRKALPRTYDLDMLSGRLIAKGVLTDEELKDKGYDKDPGVGWAEVLIVSTVYIFVLLGLAGWRMATRDG